MECLVHRENDTASITTFLKSFDNVWDIVQEWIIVGHNCTYGTLDILDGSICLPKKREDAQEDLHFHNSVSCSMNVSPLKVCTDMRKMAA